MKKYIKKEWKDFIKSWNTFVKKNKLFMILPHNLLLFVIFVITLFFGLSLIINHSSKVLYLNESSTKVYDPLLVYEQKYDFDDIEINRKVTKLCLKFATYKRVNKASYEFRIYQGTKLYQNEVFTADLVNENEFKCFKTNLPNIDDFEFAIKPLYADSSNVISLYGDKNNVALRLENNFDIYNSYTIMLVLYMIAVMSICYIKNKNQ